MLSHSRYVTLAMLLALFACPRELAASDEKSRAGQSETAYMPLPVDFVPEQPNLPVKPEALKMPGGSTKTEIKAEPHSHPEGGHHEAELRFEEPEHHTNGIYPAIEYKLWRARRRALDVVITDPVDDGIPQGVIESVFWDTQSGVRAGFGVRLPDPHWEISAFYTYFHSHDNRLFQRPDGGTLYAILTSPSTIIEADAAFAQTNLDYDVVDIEFGPRLEVGECFTLRVFGGSRTGWINQRLNAFFNGRDANQAMFLNELRFKGSGLRVGGEGHWHFYPEFTLFARASMSLVLGRFKETHFEANDGGLTLINNVQEIYEQIVPVLDLGIGVTWQIREDMRLGLGYELVNWFNMVNSPDFVDDVHVGKISRRSSDITIDGLFVELQLTF